MFTIRRLHDRDAARNREWNMNLPIWSRRLGLIAMQFAVLGLSWAAAGHRVLSQPIVRPSVNPARADRLAPHDGVTKLHDLPPGRSDQLSTVVLHAGSAVRLRIPEAWQVDEVPAGRLIRLVLMPPKNDVDSSIEVMWLSLRYSPRGFPTLDDGRFVELAAERVHDLTGDETLTVTPAMVDIGGARWARIAFRTPFRENDLGTATNYEPIGSVSDHGREGLYFLQQFGWGRLEAFVTSKPNTERHGTDLQLVSEILRTVVVTPPSPPSEPSITVVRSAAPILGSWKGSRSRVRLLGDGSITIVTDHPFDVESTLASVGDSRPDPTPMTANTLRGRFTAQGDILFTTWADGSDLNYRWKLHRGYLLLTDDRGRTSKLSPILE